MQRGFAKQPGLRRHNHRPVLPRKRRSPASAHRLHRDDVVPPHARDPRRVGRQAHPAALWRGGLRERGLHRRRSPWAGTGAAPSSFSYDITRYVTPGADHNLVRLRARRDALRRAARRQAVPRLQVARAATIRAPPASGRRCGWKPCRPYGLKDCRRSCPTWTAAALSCTPRFYAMKRGLRFRATLPRRRRPSSARSRSPAGNGVPCALPIAAPKPWSPDDPFLYDLTLEVLADGDRASTPSRAYAGLRKVHVEGNQVFLNNEPFYLRLVLDQGFYPDGIWTAPSDAALKHDIELSMAAGLQRRAPAPKGLRAALPLLGRPAGLPDLGRVLQLGHRRQGRGQRAQLPQRVARDRDARPQPPLDHRLDALQRDARRRRRAPAQPPAQPTPTT